jgi:hypothetical protein
MRAERIARQVAIKYSGVKDGEMLPIVLQVRTGAVDRGACIRDFSQYQSEVGLFNAACVCGNGGGGRVKISVYLRRSH